MLELKKFSHDKRLNQLCRSVISEFKAYAEHTVKYINQYAKIGLALSSEKDINKLLEMIVDTAREITDADAGTLYIPDEDFKYLRFAILQNQTMNTRICGIDNKDVSFPEVPLYIRGEPNYSNVSSYVALTGEIINIPDVYEADGFDFSGPRNYDASTGYRSKSMLVIPMKNHEDKIIGVLQLLNSKEKKTKQVIAFSEQYIDLVASLASQAAVALTNVQLIQNLKDLFYSFIQTIATAIDEKSEYTGGHIKRVVDLTMLIAENINKDNEMFNKINFNNDELEELRIAAWMHDIGKITTPEYVVDKASKLETIYDRLDLIETRFKLIEQLIENQYLKEKISLINPSSSYNQDDLENLDKRFSKEMEKIRQDFEFIKQSNSPGEFMKDKDIERLKSIVQHSYLYNGDLYPYLKEDEFKNLSIRKGSLTQEEREIIENHAMMTLKILKQLPFPKNMSKVPEYAAGHHEKLDGSGYPKGLAADEISIQMRIMAIADIFEALTAKDRPYREPMKISEALKIMGFMKKDNHIDPDIYDFFVQKELFKDYAKQELNPEQLDI